MKTETKKPEYERGDEPDELDEEIRKSIILTTASKILNPADKIVNWCKYSSVWPLTFGLACCAIEMMSAVGARNDLARFGMEVYRASPRQADLMIVAGTVTHRMAPRVKRLYDQMAEPKYVLAMGACAISGGPFLQSYAVLKGADKIIPVDVYIPGCPPKPEALIDGIMKLREKISKERPLTQKICELTKKIKK